MTEQSENFDVCATNEVAYLLNFDRTACKSFDLFHEFGFLLKVICVFDFNSADKNGAKMDYLDIMFNKNRPFKPIKISGGTTNGRIKITEQREPVTRLPQSDLSILEDDVANMRQKLINNIKDTMANEDNLGVPLDEGDTIYKKYKFDQRSVSAKNLPIYASEKKIVSKISKYPVVVIEGSTGCGKSTQVSCDLCC